MANKKAPKLVAGTIEKDQRAWFVNDHIVDRFNYREKAEYDKDLSKFISTTFDHSAFDMRWLLTSAIIYNDDERASDEYRAFAEELRKIYGVGLTREQIIDLNPFYESSFFTKVRLVVISIIDDNKISNSSILDKNNNIILDTNKYPMVDKNAIEVIQAEINKYLPDYYNIYLKNKIKEELNCLPYEYVRFNPDDPIQQKYFKGYKAGDLIYADGTETVNNFLNEYHEKFGGYFIYNDENKIKIYNHLYKDDDWRILFYQAYHETPENVLQHILDRFNRDNRMGFDDIIKSKAFTFTNDNTTTTDPSKPFSPSENMKYAGSREYIPNQEVTEIIRRKLLSTAIKTYSKLGTPMSLVEALENLDFTNVKIIERIPGVYYNGVHKYDGQEDYSNDGAKKHWSYFSVEVEPGHSKIITEKTESFLRKFINKYKNLRSTLYKVYVKLHSVIFHIQPSKEQSNELTSIKESGFNINVEKNNPKTLTLIVEPSLFGTSSSKTFNLKYINNQEDAETESAITISNPDATIIRLSNGNIESNNTVLISYNYTNIITDEAQTFSSDIITLNGSTNVANVVVKSSDGASTYTPDVDYTVSGNTITRVNGNAIPADATVLVSYNYTETVTDETYSFVKDIITLNNTKDVSNIVIKNIDKTETYILNSDYMIKGAIDISLNNEYPTTIVSLSDSATSNVYELNRDYYYKFTNEILIKDYSDYILDDITENLNIYTNNNYNGITYKTSNLKDSKVPIVIKLENPTDQDLTIDKAVIKYSLFNNSENFVTTSVDSSVENNSLIKSAEIKYIPQSQYYKEYEIPNIDISTIDIDEVNDKENVTITFNNTTDSDKYSCAVYYNTTTETNKKFVDNKITLEFDNSVEFTRLFDDNEIYQENIDYTIESKLIITKKDTITDSVYIIYHTGDLN